MPLVQSLTATRWVWPQGEFGDSLIREFPTEGTPLIVWRKCVIGRTWALASTFAIIFVKTFALCSRLAKILNLANPILKWLLSFSLLRSSVSALLFWTRCTRPRQTARQRWRQRGNKVLQFLLWQHMTATPPSGTVVVVVVMVVGI